MRSATTAAHRRAYVLTRILLGGVLVATLPSAIRWRQERIDLAIDASETARRARGMLDGRRYLADTLVARTLVLDRARQRLISGRSGGSATGALATFLSQSADDVGLSVVGMRMSTDTTDLRFLRVTAHVDAAGDISGLMQFLLLVEAGEPLLEVRTLTVTPAADRAPEASEHLSAQLVISGLAVRGAAATMASAGETDSAPATGVLR